MRAIRTCVVCGKKRFKFSLVRLVRTESGDIAVDPAQTGPGRGAYLCPDRECVNRLSYRHLARAFRIRIDAGQTERIRLKLENLLGETKLFSLAGLAFRAGKVAAGTAATEEAIQKKKARLLILADDISANTEEKFQRLAKSADIPILKAGTKASWGTFFKRDELGVLAILDRHFAKGILQAAE